MPIRTLALICFFLSGATGLLYEIVWIRLFGFTLGNTHHALSIVVAVFMGGLALGSVLGGRVADRSANPLRLYGVLILGVGLVCLAVPLLVETFQPLFRWIYRFNDGEPEAGVLLLAKALVSALILLVPTTLMGATLPVLARFFTRSLASVGWDFGRVYAVNTLGAVVGAFLTGFVLIPWLGLWGCIVLAVVVDFMIGLSVILLARQLDATGSVLTGAGEALEPVPEPEAPLAADGTSPFDRWDLRLPLIAFFVSGFANMILQVSWTKTLVGTIGNSTYAFGLIVTLFILGIGLGGAIMARFADRIKNLPYVLGALMGLTALVVLVTIPILGIFPALGAQYFQHASQSASSLQFSDLLYRQAAMVAAILLPATTLMGMVFPLVGKWVSRSMKGLGRSIGNAYFANTAGSILGTLCAGFVLVPYLGRVYASFYVAVGLSLVMGAILCLRTARSHVTRIAPLVLVVVLVLVAYLTRPFGVFASTNHAWHPAIQSLGVYLYYDIAEGEQNLAALEEKFIKNSIIHHYSEGVHAPVAVVEHPHTGSLTLRISGKADASATPDGTPTADTAYQLASAHIPMLLHPSPRDVLTLGLGSGVTLGSLTLYAAEGQGAVSGSGDRLHSVERIDSLEISREVKDAVERHFSDINHDATRHPRVRHVLGDGRNHLFYTQGRYDVITSVPSNPWIAGIGNLFTVEFFEIVKSRLKPGGVFCQWIHKLDIREDDFKVVLRSVERVFGAHLQLWDLELNCFLIASDAPLGVDLERVRRALADESLADELAILGVERPESLLRYLKLDRAALERYVGAGRVNSDLDPCLEFSAPHGLYGHHDDTVSALVELSPSKLDASMWRGGGPELGEGIRKARQGFHVFKAMVLKSNSDPSFAPREARALLEEIVAAEDAWVTEKARQIVLKLAQRQLALARRARSLAQREAHLKRASAFEDGFDWIASLELALSYVARTPPRPDLALPILDRLYRQFPEQAGVLHKLAVARAQVGDLEGSLEAFDAAAQLATNARERAVVHNDKGYALELSGEIERALLEYEKAVKVDPSYAGAIDNFRRMSR